MPDMQLTVSVPEPCVSGFDLAPLALTTATLGRPRAPLPRNRARYSGCFRRPAGDWRTAASELRGTLHRAGVVRSLDAARLGPDRSPAAIVVAIPAKDETSSMGATLAALARSVRRRSSPPSSSSTIPRTVRTMRSGARPWRWTYRSFCSRESCAHPIAKPDGRGVSPWTSLIGCAAPMVSS